MIYNPNKVINFRHIKAEYVAILCFINLNKKMILSSFLPKIIIKCNEKINNLFSDCSVFLYNGKGRYYHFNRLKIYFHCDTCFYKYTVTETMRMLILYFQKVRPSSEAKFVKPHPPPPNLDKSPSSLSQSSSQSSIKSPQSPMQV